MKREYTITMPLTGTVTKTVVAESKEEAVEQIHKMNMDDIMDSNNVDFTWDFCENIVEGNVFCGIQRQMEIEVGEEVEE